MCAAVLRFYERAAGMHVLRYYWLKDCTSFLMQLCSRIDASCCPPKHVTVSFRDTAYREPPPRGAAEHFSVSFYVEFGMCTDSDTGFWVETHLCLIKYLIEAERICATVRRQIC